MMLQVCAEFIGESLPVGGMLGINHAAVHPAQKEDHHA
jgi:hypothetical protein